MTDPTVETITYDSPVYTHRRGDRQVTRWYNREYRSWVVVEVDKSGYDEGRASEYIGSGKADAIAEVEYIFSQPKRDNFGF